MTAFSDSGHSDPADFTILNGCFRPQADVGYTLQERLNVAIPLLQKSSQERC